MSKLNSTVTDMNSTLVSCELAKFRTEAQQQFPIFTAVDQSSVNYEHLGITCYLFVVMLLNKHSMYAKY